ncbi:MAG: UDP-N-acetylmuramate dehydrogenase [bacterium]
MFMLSKVDQNVPLSDKNWFRVGGAARYFVEPKTEQEFGEILRYAHAHGLKTVLIGDGANSLVSDAGFDGLVIRPAIKDITFDGQDSVMCGAGVLVQDLIDTCLDRNLVGLEEFSGIPGSVGGSVFINIHYFSGFFGDFIVGARVIDKDTGISISVDKAWFDFGYDTSKLCDGQYYVTQATFKLKKTDDLGGAYAKGARDQIIRHRNSRYPTERTCGSFFRNFHDHEITHLVNGKKLPFTAYYLDKIGVKGSLCVGKACVSHKHANMIVTSPGATAQDVIDLARKMQELVYKEFGMIPQAECQFIGFDGYPLHTKM